MREHFQSDQQIVDRLEACLNKLASMRETVMDLARQNRNEEAVAYMEANNIPTIKAAQAELDLLIENSDLRGEELISGPNIMSISGQVKENADHAEEASRRADAKRSTGRGKRD